MKFVLSLLTAALISVPALCHAGTAQARLYCLSFKLFQGTNQFGDTLSVNSIWPGGTNEVIPWGMSPGSELTLPTPVYYTSALAIHDKSAGADYGGTIDLNIYGPTLYDDNFNMTFDFLEVARPIPAGTMTFNGDYSLGIHGQDQIWCYWNRAANSTAGTVQLQVLGGDGWGTFNHKFEIIEYRGPMTYTPGSSVVTATLNLPQSGRATNTVQGTLRFVKDASDPHNRLTLQPGTLTFNSQTLNYTNHVFTRDSLWTTYPTNYQGFVEFDNDNNQSTLFPYQYWVLSIDDPNDSNGNTIPDFSDDFSGPVLVVPRAPQISLAPGAGNLQLTIHGDVGFTNYVQEISSLVGGTWTTVQTNLLSSDPQMFTLPLPASPKYWRVLAVGKLQ